MSNVFISHSSKDKPFVRRLAIGLLSEGIPVWLDSWRMSVGDSLLDNIYDAIDASSVVILVISKNAVDSGWVNRELNAALSKEQEYGRKFLLPIRIDDCKMPSKVADRLYADFASQAFAEPLSKLIRVLVTMGCRDLTVAPDRELLGLSFTREVHLDTASLQKSMRYLYNRHPNITLAPTQIVINDDPDYELLRSKLHTNIDDISQHIDYSPELERDLKETADTVVNIEDRLTMGIAELLNNRRPYESTYWYGKLVRGQLVYQLWSHQLRGDASILDYGRRWGCAILGSNWSAAEFFETKRVEIVDVWRRSRTDGKYFHLWIGAEEGRNLLDENGKFVGSGAYYDMCRGVDEDKYVFPQMVQQYLAHPVRTGPPIWKLEDAVIGIS